MFIRDKKERHCAHVQPYHRALFETWLVKQAWDEIERAKQFVSASTTQASISVLLQDLTAKRYAQGSKNYDDASRSPDGVKYLLLVMLREEKGNEDVNEEWIEKWVNEKPQEAIRVYNEAIGLRPRTKADKDEGEEADAESKSGPQRIPPKTCSRGAGRKRSGPNSAPSIDSDERATVVSAGENSE